MHKHNYLQNCRRSLKEQTIPASPVFIAVSGEGALDVGLQGRDAMIRSELVQQLTDETPGLSLREVDIIVDAVFEKVADQLANGGRVELRGFGAFSTRDRDGRDGRNPRTGEAVKVPAKRVPYFKAGKEMRDRLNG